MRYLPFFLFLIMVSCQPSYADQEPVVQSMVTMQ